MNGQIKFADIYNSFDNNMQALYLLHIAIEDTIGKEEWENLEKYYQDICPLFGDNVDPLEVQEILEHLIKIDTEDDTLDFKKIWQTMGIDADEIYTLEGDKYIMLKDYQEKLKEWTKANPENANIFFRTYLKTQRPGMFKSELSRQGLLPSAVSQFEFLLLHLIRAYFIHYEKDDALSNEELEIEQLDEYISKKLSVTSLKFLSSNRKIGFLLGKFPLDNKFSREKLTEIFERRNVFTHRSGRADQIYLNTSKALYKNKQIALGSRLRISKSYIKEAIEYLHLWGLILCRKIWEKSEMQETKTSKEILNTIMQFIREERFEFGLCFCENTINNLQFKLQLEKEYFLINHAICAEKLGNNALKDKILNRIRQTPRQSVPAIKKKHLQVVNEPLSNSILMAVNALQNKTQPALCFMRKAIEAGEITFLDLDYWVIFDYLRNDPQFQKFEKQLEAKIKII
ncbi:MAG: hypothetical protein LC099_07335 [Anaerolineales bacterium]|nr:hypothetical protein [Anaerolineales bacterium]